VLVVVLLIWTIKHYDDELHRINEKLKTHQTTALIYLNILHCRMERSWLISGALFLVALVIVLLAPYVVHEMSPSGSMPSIILFAVVGLSLILCTAASLYFGVKSELHLVPKFFVFALAYNSLIVIARFVLGPYGFYLTNQTTSISSFMFSGPLFAVLIGASTMLLYLGGFLLLYYIAKRKLREIPSEKKHLPLIIKLAGASLAVGLFIFLGGWMVMFIVSGPALIYTSFAFAAPTGILLAFVLIAAILFLRATLKTISEQAKAVRSVALFSSFLWVGLSFILAYHALWIVYVIMITSLWPLRTYTPK